MYSYQDLLVDVTNNGEPHNDRTGVGTTSVFGRQWRHNMSDGFPLLTTKSVSLRWVAEELFWFLSGSTNERDLSAKGVDIWAEWSNEDGELGPIYGSAWRNFGGVDQIANVYDMLENDPNSRRILVSAWNVPQLPNMALQPCHYGFQLKVHDNNAISLHMTQRSADLFLGVGFNIASYALLLELFAWTTGRVSRELIISFGDLHIYDNHVDQVELQIGREPFLLPEIKIDERLKNGGLEALLDCKWEDITLNNYKHHPKIKGDVAV